MAQIQIPIQNLSCAACAGRAESGRHNRSVIEAVIFEKAQRARPDRSRSAGTNIICCNASSGPEHMLAHGASEVCGQSRQVPARVDQRLPFVSGEDARRHSHGSARLHDRCSVLLFEVELRLVETALGRSGIVGAWINERDGPTHGRH